MLDQLLQALIALAPRTDFALVPLHNPRRGADARVFGAGSLAAARDAVAALPDVAAVHARGDSLTVRFADAALARTGARLEAGEARALDARDLLAGEELLVNFCDANPTKALHVGHLRNLALGQALAGALAAAGARVVRQSQVSDYCRSMGEALAGYMELPPYVTPRTLGVKSDHFVGECFGRYAARAADGGGETGAGAQVGAAPPPRNGAPWAGGGGTEAGGRGTEAGGGGLLDEGCEDPALSAEAAVRADLADELLERLAADEEEIVTRWRRLREWALCGHSATLAALGVRIDRHVYESDSRPLTRWILDRGLAGGVLTRAASGAVVYETREAEYPRLLLARADGFPTQHLRTFALWHSLRDTLDEVRTVELVGEEWHAYVRYHGPLMHGERPGPAKDALARRIDPLSVASPRSDAPAPHPRDYVVYGMVTVEGGAVKSSHGRPPLVDGLLERLTASSRLKELVARGEGRFSARELAALVTLGFYLGRPTRRPVDLTLREMLDLDGGVGWDLARAVVRAWDPSHDGPPDPAPEEPDYRRTVLQSQVHRRQLARAVDQLDVYELARFYGHLSRRFAAAEASARTARVMRALLSAGIGALGLPCARPTPGVAR
ncbi:MAG TPA: arginine--tRNA ligase [Solirubrobacteraceae bacterium]|nr:arginine--tRNA ligase [Solirubrobacteraceae bacterium]